MLQNLINYTSIADRMIIDTFLEAGKPMPDAEYLFSHILNAQHIWMKRVLYEETEYDRLQVHPVGEFEKIHLTNIESILQVFHTRDPDEQIIYENSAGDKFDNKISDILFSCS